MLTWRRDAVLAELDASCLGHPLGRPRGRQDDVHGDVGVPLVSDAALDVLADGVERRASRVCRRDVDIDVTGCVDADIAEDAEIRDGQGGHLRIGDRADNALDLDRLGNRGLAANSPVCHQVTPGNERWRCCISASMYPKDSVCSPRRPPDGVHVLSGAPNVASPRTRRT